ncbi:MAG: hypothetical protein ACI4T6_09855 [Candidatus Flemingiibacterium sp.]
MTDTIRELINRVLDYVAKTRGAHFEVWKLERDVLTEDNNYMRFTYVTFDHGYYYISRGNCLYWSAQAALTEDNLRYLVEQLEGEK